MSGEAVIKLYSSLNAIGILVWIDGGWAVDALLEKQTREHEDLDLGISRADLERCKEYLLSQGYTETSRDEEKMWDAIMVSPVGLEVELHAFDLDDSGEVIKGLYWDDYDNDSLGGTGRIEGVFVRCVSLAQLVKTYNGSKRELKAKDYADMEQLSNAFGVAFQY